MDAGVELGASQALRPLLIPAHHSKRFDFSSWIVRGLSASDPEIGRSTSDQSSMRSSSSSLRELDLLDEVGLTELMLKWRRRRRFCLI